MNYPRIITGMSNAEYHGHRASVSCSGIKQFLVSPAHFRAYLDEEFHETPAKRFGRITHMAVLEPEVFAASCGVGPNEKRNTKKGKDAWAAWHEENPDVEAVTPDEMESLRRMQQAVYAHPAASRLLSSPGPVELSAFWMDMASGEACRCRPDKLREDGIIVDYKTTENADPRRFAKSCGNYGYHVQEAMYRDGLEANGVNVQAFVFVAQEKTPPYAVGVYQLEPRDVMLGRGLYQDALLNLAQCKIEKKWPAYSDRVETITLPGWAYKQQEEAA